VIDNGVGVSGSEASSGHGLRNMGQRAEALGGGLELVANPAGGTALTWRIPTTGG
jgi:signal transduction histidine kinase